MSFDLNKAQKQVVEHTNGPLLVVAGAGTGKTRVIVERICRLLDEQTPAKSILALTFTEKAASEMLERVLEARGKYELELPIMTFNAYGESILREFSSDAGLVSNFLLMGDGAKKVFLTEHRQELELDYFAPPTNPSGQLADISKYFSKLKQYVITPNIYEDFVASMPISDEAERLEKTKHQELSRAYKNYLRLCKERGVIDYDDQIYAVIELLQTRPNVRKVLTERYKTIMVDEFQDTNPMQSMLIDLLVNKKQDLMVVGDDDQSIYGFRGATLANILTFKERYSSAKEVTLTENYRSTQSILNTAYQLITNNNPNRLEAKLGINKKLLAIHAGVEPALHCFSSLTDELDWIAKDIQANIDGGVAPGSIAIICRRNVTAKQMSQALDFNEVDHVVSGLSYDLYKTPVVRVIIEALKAIAGGSDINLHHTLAGPLFNCSSKELAELSLLAKQQHLSLEEQINKDETNDSELKIALEKIKSWRHQAPLISIGKLVYKVLDESGYRQSVLNEPRTSAEDEATISHLSQFFKTLTNFERIATQPTALQYLEDYATLEVSGETESDDTLLLSDDKVNVLTVHKSKGLEWEHVYIPDLTEGSFPLRNRTSGIKLPETLAEIYQSEADEHIAEERRLLYVALTRAKTNLTLSYSKKHYTPTPRKPSRFISEIFDSLPEAQEHQTLNEQQISFDFHEAPASNVPIPRSMYDGQRYYLSVSQISKFIDCPLDFYYRFVLGAPEAKSSAANYGSALHACFQKINEAKRTGTTLSLSELSSELEAGWENSVYETKDDSDKAYKRAKATLERFYKTHFVEDDLLPVEIEWPFALHLTQENLVIRGRIDVVLPTANGIEIRDYKTSNVETSEKAKARASGNKQLTLYALVWQELNNELPERVSLEFVESGLVGSVKKTQRGIDGMRAKLSEITTAIKMRQFKPGNDHTYCLHPPLD